jgi:glycosyltransferase involved in cell wall biosynthesis
MESAPDNPGLPSLSVAIMAFNEAPSLEQVFGEIRGELERIGVDYEIIVIDDGSTDGTGAIADRLAREYNRARVIHHPVNLGLGAVYRAAFCCGTKDLATAFPADGQFDPGIISQFMRRFDTADMVLGYIPEYRSSRSFLARAFSWCERMLYKVLFGSFPEFQGIMMFRRALVDTVPLTSSGRGWMIQMELILRFLKKGYRIVGEPTGLRARMSGASKVMNVRSVLSNLCQVFQLRMQLWKSDEAAPAPR